MPSLLSAITFLLALSISINLTSAAHAGFHVQFPWMTRGKNPRTRPEIDRYNPFCGKRDDFPYIILQDVPIQPSGQLCVNVTIPFQTKVDEMGVMYFEAVDTKTGNLEHHCSDVKMVDMVALPEDHPAMCAANNETLIPMPDEYL
ncbi:hypothetical protein ETB97_005941 [Aspergillus alliaceus]|uniref:Uncharacterized protein n=1 Tax=Petromyces alliaceus TaxID=209559 RepID=A0A8H6E2P6_PETAA|nr:hypothetical protein ETB97_005941 [Aspergillus burnettii]